MCFYTVEAGHATAFWLVALGAMRQRAHRFLLVVLRCLLHMCVLIAYLHCLSGITANYSTPVRHWLDSAADYAAVVYLVACFPMAILCFVVNTYLVAQPALP